MVDYFVPEFADRAPQVRAFDDILAGRLKRETFMIRGGAEVGKSFLLDQFAHMARHVAPQYLVSRLDFRDGEIHTFLSIIQTAVADLGAPAFVATLAEIYKITQGSRHDITFKVEEIRPPGADSGGITIRDSEVEVAGDMVAGNLFRNNFFLPPTEDLPQRQALRQQISSTFFGELRALARTHPVILSYDSLESAPQVALEWLNGVLLDEVARVGLPGVMVLVAGRVVPDVAHMLVPRVVVTELTNFDLKSAAEYWVHRRQLPGEDLQRVFEETGGHPRRLAEKANDAGGAPLVYQVLVI